MKRGADERPGLPQNAARLPSAALLFPGLVGDDATMAALRDSITTPEEPASRPRVLLAHDMTAPPAGSRISDGPAFFTPKPPSPTPNSLTAKAD